MAELELTTPNALIVSKWDRLAEVICDGRFGWCGAALRRAIRDQRHSI
jgi:hypothetical protein